MTSLGVASLDGWAVVDDTFNAVVEPATDWVELSRNRAGVGHSPAADYYIFVFGRDFRGAVAAHANLTGRQPSV